MPLVTCWVLLGGWNRRKRVGEKHGSAYKGVRGEEYSSEYLQPMACRSGGLVDK